jgi:hypothetical protein
MEWQGVWIRGKGGGSLSIPNGAVNLDNSITFVVITFASQICRSMTLSSIVPELP